MAPMGRRLLLVWHSRTGLAQQMADGMKNGALATAAALELPLTVNERRACEATATDLLAADGYLFCAPENLASVSGEMLEFFHRTYYAGFDAEECSLLLGRPVGIAIAAGSDGSSAAQQVERISRGWRLRSVAETFIYRNEQPQTREAILTPKRCPPHTRERCAELGGLVAATVLL